MGLDLVLWDLDGTLTDSGPGIIGAYQHTLARYGLRADVDALRRSVGPPLRDGLARLGLPADQIEAAVREWRAWYVQHGIFDNSLYQGIVEALDRLAAAGVRMGVATAKLQESAVEVLEHFGLLSYFDPIVGGSRDGTRVHKDEIIAVALADAGLVGSARVVMVGDRDMDMYGALVNGAVPVGVTWGYGTAEELRAAGARHVVGTANDLLGVLLAWAP